MLSKEVTMEDFPGNSNAARKPDPEPQVPENVTELKVAAASEPKKVRKVADGKVSKKPLGQKFKAMFVHDGGSFAEHLIEDVIVPMAKDMALSLVVQIGDGIKRGFEDMIFGPDETGRRRSSTTTIYGNNRPQVNYQRISSPTTIRPGVSNRHGARQAVDRRANHVKHIVLHTRDEGDDVLEELEAMIDSTSKHFCTVADYYSAMGYEDITSIDHEWGWTTLLSARVRQQDDGMYFIDMPRPRPIDY